MFFFGDGGLPPAETKRAKSTEKTYLSDVCALVNRRYTEKIKRLLLIQGKSEGDVFSIPFSAEAAERSGRRSVVDDAAVCF